MKTAHTLLTILSALFLPVICYSQYAPKTEMLVNPEQVVKLSHEVFLAVEQNGKITPGEKAGRISEFFFEITYENGKEAERKQYSNEGVLETIFTLEYDNKGNLIRNQEKLNNSDFGTIRTYTYDNEGNITEEKSTDLEGNIYNIKSYKYDSKGNKTEEKWVDNDGNTETFQAFSYDEKNNMTGHIFYKPDGKTITRQDEMTYEYDKQGNKIRYTFFIDGDMDSYHLYTYNEKGKLIKDQEFRYSREYCTLVFDEAGNITEDKSYSDDENSYFVRTFQYEFDDKGNWVKGVEYVNNKPVFLYIRKIEYK